MERTWSKALVSVCDETKKLKITVAYNYRHLFIFYSWVCKWAAAGLGCAGLGVVSFRLLLEFRPAPHASSFLDQQLPRAYSSSHEYEGATF